MTNANSDIAKLEADLWEAADNVRANSKLTSSDYFMPVLGVIFLRHAANRYDAASAQIAADQAAGKAPKRPLQPADYVRRRALWLLERARFDKIMEKASVGDATDLPRRVTEAIEAIEAEFEPLKGVLPKDYGIFENDVLEERRDNADAIEVLKALSRIVNEAIRAQQHGEDHAEGLTVDLSQVDFEKLRDEFASKVRRKRAPLKDIRDLVEAKLAKMLAVAPLRMDFCRKYQEIVADYNREKDRATVEATFEKLMKPAGELDAEQRRAAEEGLSFTEPETNALADRIYDCVWARRTAEPAWMAA